MCPCLRWLRCRAMPFLLALPLHATLRADGPAKQGQQLFQDLCVHCHGAKGEGNEALKVPSIASRPDWYVLGQFQHFAEGRRGKAVDGPQAMVMAATIKVLSPAQRAALAACVESLPLVTPLPDAKPVAVDINEGKFLFEEHCMECHRYNATGERVFGSPPLIGVQGWYLRAQLHKFQTGARGVASPTDANGLKMSVASRYAETQRDVENVIAYVLSLNRPAESTAEVDSPFDALVSPANP